MYIYPYAVFKDFIQLFIRIFVLFYFCSTELTPETFAASMTVFSEGTSTDCQLWRWVLPRLFLLFSENGMWTIEAFFKFIHGRPTYILTTSRFSMSKHGQYSSRTHIQQKVFDKRQQQIFRILTLSQSLKQLEDKVRHRIQVLDAGLRVVGEALHLDKVYREIADFIPKVQYNIDLYT